MPDWLPLGVSLVALLATLAAAIARPRWLPEAAAALLGAGVRVAVGAISVAGARHALGQLGPTVGFLAALLVLAEGGRRLGQPGRNLLAFRASRLSFAHFAALMALPWGWCRQAPR